MKIRIERSLQSGLSKRTLFAPSLLSRALRTAGVRVEAAASVLPALSSITCEVKHKAGCHMGTHDLSRWANLPMMDAAATSGMTSHHTVALVVHLSIDVIV